MSEKKSHSKKHPPHSLNVQRVVRDLHSNVEEGLTEKEVKERIRSSGKNVLPEEAPSTPLELFLRQFRSPLIFILMIAGFVTFILGERLDSIVIFGAVFLNTFIGYFQENKATNSLFALKKILKRKALVLREGMEKEIPQEEVVPGDIIMLEPGNSVPADGRIIESWQFHVNEAVLTGEWLASLKHNKVLSSDAALADRDNMVFMGSTIVQGNAKAVVIATGLRTQLGKIADLLKGVKEEKTPYQIKLSRFSWTIGIIIGILATLIFAQGVLTGRDAVEMFTIAVAIAVAAIPEGLPIAMTIVLALSMQRILARGGLVKNLTSAETLGSTSVIATDKTLTLTEGKMEVEEIFTFKEAYHEEILRAAALANEAFIENPDAVFEKWIIRGRPTDKALIRVAMDAGISKVALERELPLVFRLPFDSERKYIASFHRKAGRGRKTRIYVSGAPEKILDLCRLSKRERNSAEEILLDLTERGLRVIALAYKDMQLQPDLLQVSSENEEKKDISMELQESIENLKCMGFIALKDPLRKEVKTAIAFARKAGMKVLLVTGDHLLTAKAVAKELGLPTDKKNLIEGGELTELSDEDFQKRLHDISVYARVEPAHKLRIIKAWQDKGEVIAMTGDGVNDAPALKRADIGLALGSGTDVAKEAADIILLEDRFSIIPAAIREGRVIIDNIRKTITYLLSSSFTKIILISTSLILRAPFLPVTALQILWINLVLGSLPGIALTTEKAEKDVMTRSPQKKTEPLLTAEMKTIIFTIGLATDFLLLGLFFFLLNFSSYTQIHIQTFIFVGLGIDSLFYVFACRSLRKNIWDYNPFSNRFLNLSVFIGFFFLIAAVYLPPFTTLLKTETLTPFDWSLLLGLGFINLALIEAAKWYYINKKKVS